MIAGDTPTLVRASPADAAAIRRLTTADYQEAVRSHRFDLLYVTGELAALFETIGRPDHLLIENVAVSPSFQGCGYGRMLLAHAETLAVALALGEVRLCTSKIFAENVRLYLRLGYRVDREEALNGGTAALRVSSLRERLGSGRAPRTSRTMRAPPRRQRYSSAKSAPGQFRTAMTLAPGDLISAAMRGTRLEHLREAQAVRSPLRPAFDLLGPAVFWLSRPFETRPQRTTAAASFTRAFQSVSWV